MHGPSITSPPGITAFFKDPIPNAVIVFHCEFSHNRGPQLAGLFREIDRNMNRLCYPTLFYPHVYVLDGGYRQFFANFPALCHGGYTPMLDEFHRSNGDLTKATTLF
jgi:M-phase inducer tyrosine phosphatase